MCSRAPTEGWSAAGELDGRELFGNAWRMNARGRFVLAAGPEADDVAVMRDQTAVGDRAAGHVAGQVFQNVFRPSVFGWRRFDEHDPAVGCE